MATKQYVVFKIGKEDFALDISKVKEIIKPAEIARVPNVPDFVEGMINMRGSIHAVMNLRSKLNMPKKEYDEETKIIFVNLDTVLAGIVVDGVAEIIRVEEEEIDTTPEMISKVDAEYISGVVKIQKRIIMLINIEKVFEIAA